MQKKSIKLNKELRAVDFKPLFDNLIIEPIKIEVRGDFVRPQNEEDKAELGIILAVADQIKEDFKVGDTVMFNKYSTTKIDLGEEIIVRAEDVVAILKKEK